MGGGLPMADAQQEPMQIQSRSSEFPIKEVGIAFDPKEVDQLKKKYPDGLKYKLEPYHELEGDEMRLDLADMIATD